MRLTRFALISNERALDWACPLFRGLGASDECGRFGIVGIVVVQGDFLIHEPFGIEGGYIGAAAGADDHILSCPFNRRISQKKSPQR